jgi:peptidoglycan/LPS O-acetylase OafA/YrhL
MQRNINLDILRATAILMVLTAHIFFLQTPSWWNAWAIGAGWAGVDLFFVLSGFLISRLLFSEYQRTGQIAYGRFAFRRGMKIGLRFMPLASSTWSGDSGVPILITGF